MSRAGQLLGGPGSASRLAAPEGMFVDAFDIGLVILPKECATLHEAYLICPFASSRLWYATF